ncbi:flavoprotein [Amycolatopsis sp. NPDC059657]|uniref:flavoprotein n=1 Tax=Amycolatopsis sp. NPDC059657 TaxID=3346899 RepID=UPI00366F4E81
MNREPRWLYLVAASAPPVLRIEEFVAALHADGWKTCLIATPTAASWVDLPVLSASTGCLVRVEARRPGESDSMPRADAVIAAPMTFNSINKWAAGFSDNLALGVLNEMLGSDVPIIAAPCVKAALRKHPAYGESVATLGEAGVEMLDPDAVGFRADDGLMTLDWRQISEALKVASDR